MYKRSIAVVVAGALLVAGAAALSRSKGHVPSYLLNADVRQSTIRTTICTPGYTKTIRPSNDYTHRLKMSQLGDDTQYVDKDPSHYEEDHWIALEVGGNPKDYRNLWPEPWDDARKKDKVENDLHSRVCSNKMSLAEAQWALYTQWDPKRLTKS